MKSIHLVLVIHLHQPVGNFDHVIDQCCNDAYVPFLDQLARYPSLRINLHVSGCLLEWLEARRPDVVEKIRDLAEAGRIRLIGGGFYEPILTALPEADRIGQIARLQAALKRRFGQSPRGAWLAERVWEQGLASSLARAGVEYVILDDVQLLAAGLREDELNGIYLTEDQGYTLRVLPSSETLRHMIPYRSPHEILEHLRGRATPSGDRVVVYADDGEKFGSWPGTRHVYRDGWLERFFQAIEANAAWIRTITAEEAIDRLPLMGRVYLPDSSYREMMEWSLPPEAQEAAALVRAESSRVPGAERLLPLLRGGVWRNFLRRYPESAQMYGRMIHLSRRINALRPSAKKEKALTELFRAQCNSAYWHGVFGGLYLPHLRSAVYRHLIAAENRLRDASAKPEPRIESEDFDLDGRPEIALRSRGQDLFLRPHRGGACYEWDLRDRGLNLLNTLARRREAYHALLLRRPTGGDPLKVKSSGLDRKLTFDWHARGGFIDHPWERGITLGEVAAVLRREDAPFVEGEYAHEIRRGALILRREARIGDQGPLLCVEKTLALDPKALRVEASYAVTSLGEPASLRFGVEFDFAMLGADGGKTYYRESPEDALGDFASTLELPPAPCFGLHDPVHAVDVRFSFDRPAAVWTFPVETVSMSEEGLESVYQSSAVIPFWDLDLEPGKTWRADFAIEIAAP